MLLQSKLAESEDKVAAMAAQLEQLHADRLRLENRNSVLEKVTLSTVSMQPSQFCVSSGGICPSGLPLASSFNSFVQVLEMKEIEETKPSTSSSGKMLHMVLRCHSASCHIRHPSMRACLTTVEARAFAVPGVHLVDDCEVTGSV